MPIIIPFTDEKTWLENRAQDITSTESAALFGLSPYATEFELFYLKTKRAESSFTQSQRTLWGSRLESAIAQGVAEDLDLKIRNVRRYMRHDTVARMGSSFDFEIVSHERGAGLMEIKNVDSLVYRNSWDDNEAPEHIEIQVQHQMEVANRDWCLIVPLVGGNEARPFYRERDREMGAAICAAVSRFWDNVNAGREPLPDYARDAEFVIKLHQSAGDKVLNATTDEKITALMRDYNEASVQEKTAEGIKESIKAELLDIIGDDVSKVLADGYSLSCGMVSGQPPKIITAEMLGETIGGRKGYRGFRVTKKTDKVKK